jgi:ATP-dependent Clp protease adaptor protein ClpS
MSTATEITEDVGVDIANDIDQPWVVIVWNDPINLMSYVTWVFQKLFGYSLEKATELMLDVHEKGRAVIRSVSCGKDIRCCANMAKVIDTRVNSQPRRLDPQ